MEGWNPHYYDDHGGNNSVSVDEDSIKSMTNVHHNDDDVLGVNADVGASMYSSSRTFGNMTDDKIYTYDEKR